MGSGPIHGFEPGTYFLYKQGIGIAIIVCKIKLQKNNNNNQQKFSNCKNGIICKFKKNQNVVN